MSFRYENIGVGVATVVFVLARLLTGSNPTELEGALIAVVVLGTAFAVSAYLHGRSTDSGSHRNRGHA